MNMGYWSVDVGVLFYYFLFFMRISGDWDGLCRVNFVRSETFVDGCRNVPGRIPS